MVKTGKFFNLVSVLLLLLPCLVLFAACSRAPDGMVPVPAGEFVMGSEEVDLEAKALRFGSVKPWYLNERPKRKLSLPSFYIDKYEVTNQGYKEFVDATGQRPPDYWKGGVYAEGQADHPVMYVDWYSAYAYCSWNGKRLPAEAEWEKAARGTDGRHFPWGDDYDHKKTNARGEFGGPVAVGSYENGKSPYGVYDMAGNVAEWVADWYKAYPGSDHVDKDYGEKFKVARGGGWGGVGHYNLDIYRRTSYRFYAPADRNFGDIGFRCVKSS